jgi:hypothetical protein
MKLNIIHYLEDDYLMNLLEVILLIKEKLSEMKRVTSRK